MIESERRGAVLHPADRPARLRRDRRESQGLADRGVHCELSVGQVHRGHGGADVCISTWNRLAPNTMPALAKAGANYMNSQLIRMEAEATATRRGSRSM